MSASPRAAETYHELRTALPALLPSYLAAQRWFGGKARQIRSAEITDLISLENAPSESFVLLVRLAYAAGPGETYVLPLLCTQDSQAESSAASLKVYSSTRGTDLYLRNALTDEEFLHNLLDAMEQSKVFHGVSGEVHAAPSSAFHGLCGTFPRALHPRPIKAEQSNSSIIYGDRAVLKFFRRAEEGMNPDLEIGRFLTEKKNFPNVPAVAGWFDYRAKDGNERCLGILQAFIPNVGDAWQFTLKSLSTFWKEVGQYSKNPHKPVDEHDRSGAAISKNLPAPLLDHIKPYLDAVNLLGRRTAELHLALSSEPADPDFAPEPYTASFQRGFKEALHALTERNLTLLAMKLDQLPPEMRDQARDLIARQAEIFHRCDSVLGNPIHAMRTRVHGDYHLGQVLYTGSDFVIIDFEGEPARPLFERRAKRSPLLDVAGMLRSFHYAAFSFQLEAATTEMESAELRTWAEKWYECVSDRFLTAYFGVAGEASFIPPKRDDLSALLQLHILEKAVYELGYELNNRPAWITIPLAGISQLLAS